MYEKCWETFELWVEFRKRLGDVAINIKDIEDVMAGTVEHYREEVKEYQAKMKGEVDA